MPESGKEAKGTKTRKKPKSKSYVDDVEASSAQPKFGASGQQKSNTGHGRKTRRLAELPGMPLDILFEIFGHLQPYDLLKLTRTTKDFRRLLLNKSSVSVWKATLDGVPGLPECPSTMSIPAWVNLVFSPHCHYCLAQTRHVEWRFRVRMCAKCVKEHLHDLGKIFYSGKDFKQVNGLPYSRYEALIPTRNMRNAKLYLPSDMEVIKQEYGALQGDEPRKQYILDRTRTNAGILEHAQRCEIWEQSQLKNRDAEIRHLKEERLAAIVQKLEELGWGKDVAGIRYPDSLFNVKKVNQTQPLTERIWANIKDDVLEYMRQMREKRLKREFDATVRARKYIAIEALRGYKNSKVSENLVMPGPPDYCDFDTVKEILNRPADVEVNLSSFEPNVILLPELITGWRKKIDGLLMQVVKQAKSTLPQEETLCYDDFSEEYYYRKTKTLNYPNMELSDEELLKKLKLASTVFSCRRCNPPNDSGCDDFYYYDEDWYYPPSMSKPLFYPQVLGHHCLTLTSTDFSDWAPSDPSKAFSHGDEMERSPWSCSLLTFDAYGSTKAEEVIRLCGLDPMKATAEDMDNLDLALACRLCPRDPQTGLIANNEDEPFKDGVVHPLYSWRAAIRHRQDCHDRSSFVKFRREELPDGIITAENNHRLKHVCEWFCLHCRDTNNEWDLETVEKVKRYFKIRHKDYPSPVMNRDYFRHFSGPNVEASQPSFFICKKNDQLSVFEPPVLDEDDEGDQNLLQLVRKWRDAC
ncbi:hypothetical protein GALMADRAFT_234422 [Galerina marginata CBS 339.88]|uniref:F-box domain-containing protein n=1 Tax=Galerina marginata (strain CBS 339.88) TaxID=685588 RepID=A0A067TQP1_GALM3|nr:hypothetical protein GALMADRAFT_234422 [Galerina marginata CBS 339.88]